MTVDATEDSIPILTTIIAGSRRGARSGATVDAHDPSTGKLLAHFPRLDASDVAEAVEAASAAAVSWRRTRVQDRAAALDAFADRILQRREELATLDSRDNGSPLAEMRLDVDRAVAQIRYFAGLALQIQGQTLPPESGRLNFTTREPFGVVGRIVAFNHPLMFAAVKVAAPLLAGNTVLIKPSEQTSLSALALADDLDEIFGPSVVQIITGLGSEAGDAIVAHPDVRRIAFIGSASTGRRIQARAAEFAVKSVSLELGGKNAVVVMPDADLEWAVDGAIRGMNFNWQGQSCGSTSRLLIHRDVYPEVVRRVDERMRSLRVGLPADPSTQVGAMVSEVQLTKVLDYVAIGQDEGAELVSGGTRLTDERLAGGNFVSPALFAGVKPDSRLAREEIFGPVLAAIPFDDYAEALQITNASDYGLTASIFTASLTTALDFAREAEVGYVWINEVSQHVPGAPYGGFKESGVGREEDLSEVESYTQLKNVHVRFA